MDRWLEGELVRVDDGPTDEAVTTSRLYATLAAAGTAILRSTSRHVVFRTLTEVLTEDGDFASAYVAVEDPSHPDGLRVEAGGQPTTPTAEPGRATRLDGPALTRAALAEGRVMVVSDPLLGSACAMPLRRGNDVVAVFATAMDDAGAYDGLRMHLLDRLAEEVAFALQSIADREAEVDARLARSAVQAQLVARSRMHGELARIGQLAFVAESTEDLFAEIVEAVRQVLNVDVAVLGERTEGGGLDVVAEAGLHANHLRTVDPDPRDFEGRLLLSEGPLVLAAAREGDPGLTVAADPRLQAAVGVAIRQRGAAHGLLLAGTHVPRDFAADEVDFLRSLANIAAAAIEHRHASRRLIQQALHDPLTGLPNRTLLFDRLEHAATALRPGRSLAVLLVDLDGFKLLNDALGHDVGDQLLVAVADRLRSTVRGADTVARLGGDEFAVLCVDLPSSRSATDLAERLAAAMRSPFDLETVQTFVSASIGITVHQGVAESPRALLREADAAMYAAKEAGRARYEMFDDRMRDNAVRRLRTANDLRRALDTDELELVWHPIIDLHELDAPTRRVGLEGLVRWNHPVDGVVTPDEFIGLAEDTGLIRPLGEWALQSAARQLAEWRTGAASGCPDSVAVNLSAHQLSLSGIVDTVHRTFAEAGVEPAAVELEITETALMSDPGNAIARLRELRALGFTVAIDDFGTGYSSMSYLRDLPASALKIDRSFVSRLGHPQADEHAHHGDQAIVEAIIQLAHAVGLSTTAEGVETAAQLDVLRRMGCDRAQGYLWTEPLAGPEVSAWIAALRTRTPSG